MSVSADTGENNSLDAPAAGMMMSGARIMPALFLLDQILVEDSVLHDHKKILFRVVDQLQVVQGIAVDKQQVRHRPFLNDAKLAGIGTPQAGEREQLGVVRGRHSEHFSG